MELDMLDGDVPVVLAIETGTRSLVIGKGEDTERVSVFGTTKFSFTPSSLTVGSRVFEVNSESSRPPTVMDLQEFVKILKQLSSADGGRPVRTSGSRATRTPLPLGASEQAAAIASMPNPNRHVGAADFQRAGSLAGFVEACSYFFVILSVLGSLVIAFQKNPFCEERFSSCDFGEKYPDFWLGIGAGLYAVFILLAIAMVAAYLKGKAAERGV